MEMELVYQKERTGLDPPGGLWFPIHPYCMVLCELQCGG